MLILYAVADRELPSPLPAGACGEPLVQLEADGIVGIAGAVERAPEASEPAAVAHARVVEALAELADPLLPARFGSLHATPAALGEALRQARDPLAAALRAVEGCVELGVRGVASAREDDAPPSSGREYLERLRADAAARRARPRRRSRSAPARRGSSATRVSRPRTSSRATRSTPSSARFASARRTSRSSAWSAPGRGRRTASPGPPRERARPDRRRTATSSVCSARSTMPAPDFRRRVNADPERVERGLAQLVLTLVELLRQLMERQALRRIDAGSLSDDEIERMGQTFMKLEQRMGELKREFGLEDRDLNLDLGPLGTLLETTQSTKGVSRHGIAS